MKKYILIALASALLAGNAFAALGDVMTSWPLTLSDPGGVAVSNAYIFYISSQGLDKVVTIRRQDGSVVRSWSCPFPAGNRGLAYTWGGDIWIGCMGNGLVYKCDVNDGDLRNLWNASHAPVGLAPFSHEDGGALANYLISYGPLSSSLHYHDMSTGSINYSTTLADNDGYDMAYDWRSHLIWKQNSRRTHIYGMDFQTGSLIASFPIPCPEGIATGLAYSDYILFIACTDDRIYLVECPVVESDGTSVAPASMGSIKAIYR
ncbi:MAG: hypothetical protein PVH29_08835 [Candidatus Zixiibacteriota bacterium]